MKKLLFLAALSAGAAFAATPCAQYADFSALTASAYLSGAMNGKQNVQCGSGAPTALAGTAGIDAYVDTVVAPGSFYIATVTGSPATWVQVGWPNAAQTTGSYANPAWIASFAWSKITGVPTFLLPANNLSDLTSASTARTNLGLGTAATQTWNAASIIALWSTCSGTQYLGADGACHTVGGGGTVSSVALTVPSWLAVGGSPLTTSGTLAVTPAAAQTSHQFIGTCGSATAFAPCAIVATDVPTLNQSTTGNAGTASALAATPSLCTTGQAPTGVLANGNATGCAAAGSGSAGPGYTATSATSLAIATGSTGFTTQSGLAYTAGSLSFASVCSSGAPTACFYGNVTSYSGTALVLNVTSTSGAGTHADWLISVSGATGTPGTLGTVIQYSANHVITQSDAGNTPSATASLTFTFPSTLSGNVQVKIQSTSTSATISTAVSGSAQINGATTSLPTFGPCTGTPVACPGEVFTMDSSGNWWGTSGQPGSQGIPGPAGTGGFNPQDPGEHLVLQENFPYASVNTVNQWKAECSGGYGGGGGAGIGAATVTPMYFFDTTGTAFCYVTWPWVVGGGGAYLNGGSWNYWSGSSPAWFDMSVGYSARDANSWHYIGWLDAAANAVQSGFSFVGCRAKLGGDWFAVIVNAGTDVASADTGVAVNTTTPVHIEVDNGATVGTGVANSIRCGVNGTFATVAGTIPTPSSSYWYATAGIAGQGSASAFGGSYFNIFMKGLPIN